VYFAERYRIPYFAKRLKPGKTFYFFLGMILIKELADIVGSEDFLEAEDILEDYSKDMSFTPPIRPRCIVFPENVSEVMEIVKWANRTLTPLVPISSGPPRFHGDTIPSVGGSVIVDLRKMKRIMRIDRKNRIALIEPGVTFSELIPALESEGLAPLMPLMPRKTKSVVASVLETDPIIMPKYHWDTQDPLACAEVVFGGGELFRTGEAVGPGDLEDQWRVGKAQVRGTGEAYIDFSRLLQRAQGTIGIVTWASIYCRPLPKVREAFLVPSENLNRLIDLAYKLMWRRLGDICFIVNNCVLACIQQESSNGIVRLRESLPSWTLVFTIEPSGFLPEKKAEYYKAEFINLAQSFDLKATTQVGGVDAEGVMKMVSNVSPEPYWKLRLKGGVQELFFLTTMDKVQAYIEIFYEVAAHYKFPLKDIGVYIQPILQGASCHCEFDILYNPSLPEEVNMAKSVFCEAARRLAKAGAFFARPYGPLRDITYPYVAAPLIIAQRKIKAIFDPNNIMNPGKLYFG